MGEEEPPILRMRGHEDAASIYEARKSKHVDDKGMTDLEVMAEMERVLDISVTETPKRQPRFALSALRVPSPRPRPRLTKKLKIF